MELPSPPMITTDGIPAATEPEFINVEEGFLGYDPLVFEEEFHALGFNADNNPVGDNDG